MTVFFSFIFLFISYFLSVLALMQVYFPEGLNIIEENDWKMQQFVAYKKILWASLAISSFITGIMFHFFVYPNS
jgi:hypothetical protein